MWFPFYGIGWLGFNLTCVVMIITVRSSFPFCKHIDPLERNSKEKKMGKWRSCHDEDFSKLIANILRKGNITSCHSVAVISD